MKKKTNAAKAAAKEQRATRRREAERLSDKAVLITALAILYGVLLLFLQSMGKNPVNVNGALSFLQILRWVSIAGGIIFAALSVYKERRGLMLYCGMFVYIIWSVTVILNTTAWDKSYAIVYVSLLLAIILTHVNIWLRTSGRFERTAPRVIFAAVSIAIFLLINLAYVELLTGFLAKWLPW